MYVFVIVAAGLALGLIVWGIVGGALDIGWLYRQPTPMPDPPSRAELQAHAKDELQHGWMMCFEEEDFIRAQDALDAVDRAYLPSDDFAVLDAARAWCEANLGTIDKAIYMARVAIGEARPDLIRARASALAVFGAIQVRAGNSHAALEPLQEAVRIADDPGHAALAAFYLGEALTAIGRPDEARVAWEGASRSSPATRHALLAGERLAALAVMSPYR
jgi:tetratricopeptide (TPR) repeat protein